MELAATGICHTDLGVRAGDVPIPPLPAILGHEGSGIVLGTGSDVRNVEVGDHVVLTFGSCGTCPECISGHRARCRNFIVANMRGCRPDGSHVHSCGDRPIHGSFFGQSSFATHAVVPALNVVKVRRDVPIELLGPLGCGLQTGAGTVLNHLRPEPGASLCIFGGLPAVLAPIADSARSTYRTAS